MNNKFLIKIDNIKEALDNIDSFDTKFQKLKVKNPEYNAKLSLFKELNYWVIELDIHNNENKTRKTKGTSR